jgi:hypothetical protein
MGPGILVACHKATQPDMGQNVTGKAGLTMEANQIGSEVAISYTISRDMADSLTGTSWH